MEEKRKIKEGEIIEEGKKEKKLFRSSKNQLIAGVCAGLGEYFNLDSIFFRLVFLVFFMPGVWVYLALWLIVPLDTNENKNGEETIKKNSEEMKEKAEKVVEEVKKNENLARLIIGLIIFVLGVLLLLRSFGILDYFRFDFWSLAWAVGLIYGGFKLLEKK